MKINKKIIEELTGYLKEFKLSEIEYAEGTTKVKVSRSINNPNVASGEIKEKQPIIKENIDSI
jgi:acetyl-CoA carboxylase biotin carboxyl carrier protein